MIILQSFNSSNPVRIHRNRNIAKPGKILVRLIPDQGGANFRYGFMACPDKSAARPAVRSEEHTSELQSLMRISYAVFCLKKKKVKLKYRKAKQYNTQPY